MSKERNPKDILKILLKEKKVPELKNIHKNIKLKKYSKLTRDELIQNLLNHNNPKLIIEITNKSSECKKNNNSSSLPKWEPYKSYKTQMTEKHSEININQIYTNDQESVKNTYDKHNKTKGSKKLWFPNGEEAACFLCAYLSNDDKQWLSLVAQPGAGKTSVIHAILYNILTKEIDLNKAINPNAITITTGMSDIEWYNQLLDNLRLSDDQYLWKTAYNHEKNFCIVHRSNLNKRINYILNNQDLISQHLFIIDESHFADSEKQTIEKQFERLGITEERMKEYKIKILFVSATPDVNLSFMNKKTNHVQVVLKNGNNYKGFKYYKNECMIQDYDECIGEDINNIRAIITSRFKSPRYHFIRAKNQYRKELEKLIEENQWKSYNDDSDNNIKLLFNEEDIEENSNNIIRIYKKPKCHTIILIKEKFRASKRLKLTKFVGLICEKPSKKQNTTITCNGLIPRFFGYYNILEYHDHEKPLFLCNIKCVNEYIAFTEIKEGELWKYEGKDYTSTRIKSTDTFVREYKNTVYGKMGGVKPENKRYNDVECERYKTFEEVKERCNQLFKSNCGEKQKNEYGFRINIIREDKGIHTEEFVLKNKNFGLNNDTKYRYHVCYTNIKDLKTEKHILVYHKK